MAPRPLLLDTNLLILLAVGLADPEKIRSHKRLQKFDRVDFENLLALVENSSKLVLCPNIATETSNLVRYVGEPFRSEVVNVLAELIRRTEEQIVASEGAVNHPRFASLGLADAVLLILTEQGATLLTDDLPLYLAAVGAGREAINFAHVQATRPDFP